MAKQRTTSTKSLICGAAVAGFVMAGSSGAAFGADGTAPPGRSIAYVFEKIAWAIYEAKDADGKETKADCPNGFNEGAREQFKSAFPQDNGQKWTYDETVEKREADIWWPNTGPDKFPFHEVAGKTS